MADLLASLISPSNNSSQESFHSLSSQPTSHDTIMTEPATDAHDAALRAAGLNIQGVDSYLTAPHNTSLREQSSSGRKTNSSISLDGGEPVLLGSKTSHHVSALMIACQAKGLSPIYEIDGDISKADFGGVLRIGEVTITSNERWHSKKEAKEALAEKGLESVKSMQGRLKGSGTATENGGSKNWVGLLHEYYNLIDPNRGPTYDYYSIGLAYACTCTLPSNQEERFGSKTLPFPSKKAACSNSARETVEYLIAQGLLNADGSTKARKKTKLGTAVRIEGGGLEVKKGSSYGQKVQEICPLLGLTCPQYTLVSASALAPNMLSGHASWPNEPRMPKEVGEVRNVFGKKNAREAIAEGVWEFLKELAEKRGVKIDGVDE